MVVKLQNLRLIASAHHGRYKGKWCNGNLEKGGKSSPNVTPPVYDHAYIRHYYTKTIEEFLKNKLARGRVNLKTLNKTTLHRMIRSFYSINEKTEEKEQLAKEIMTEYLPEFLD